MKYILTVLLTTLISFQVMAADLKSDDIPQWLTSIESIEPWLEQHADELKSNMDSPNNIGNVSNESVNVLKKSGLYEELNNKVKTLGYKNVEQWDDITKQITFAWIAIEMGQKEGQIEASKAQMETLKNNPNIPQAKKDMMLKMMEGALKMIEQASQSTDADINAVLPHKETLRSYFSAKTAAPHVH